MWISKVSFVLFFSILECQLLKFYEYLFWYEFARFEFCFFFFFPPPECQLFKILRVFVLLWICKAWFLAFLSPNINFCDYTILMQLSKAFLFSNVNFYDLSQFCATVIFWGVVSSVSIHKHQLSWFYGISYDTIFRGVIYSAPHDLCSSSAMTVELSQIIYLFISISTILFSHANSSAIASSLMSGPTWQHKHCVDFCGLLLVKCCPLSRF